MNVLVIGGAGFIGSHLVDALLDDGARVRVFDSLDPQVHPSGLPPSYLNPHVELVQRDIRDPDGLRSSLEGIEAIVYLAGAVGVGDSTYRIHHYTDVNVLGGANLLEILVNNRHCVRKIVLASSVTVYGEGTYSCPHHGLVYPSIRTNLSANGDQWELRCLKQRDGQVCSSILTPLPTNEEKPLIPLSVYAVTKRAQEELFLTVGRAYGIPVTVLRYFNVYGSRQALSNPYTGVAKIFACQIAEGKNPLIYEDGLQTRDFVHVSDVVQANMLALHRDEADGEIFNVGTGRPTTILELARAVAHKFGGDHSFQPTYQFRSGDVRHCWADISKIRTLLGFEPRAIFPAKLDDVTVAVQSLSNMGQTAQAHSELTQRGLIHPGPKLPS